MNRADSRLGLVLSGGGARGAFEAGVLQRLSEDRSFAEPDGRHGSSGHEPAGAGTRPIAPAAE